MRKAPGGTLAVLREIPVVKASGEVLVVQMTMEASGGALVVFRYFTGNKTL